MLRHHAPTLLRKKTLLLCCYYLPPESGILREVDKQRQGVTRPKWKLNNKLLNALWLISQKCVVVGIFVFEFLNLFKFRKFVQIHWG